MTDFRPTVTEALLEAGWTRTPIDGELVSGPVSWSTVDENGASAIWLHGDCVAHFRAYCPPLVVVAACLAAAGQTAERLADVIQLHPAR
ncbi:hypothetical protein ACWGNN_00725 [Streptomyces sp. NPDC055817]